MTTQQIDRADSGEIPPPGEVTVRIDTGEATQRIDPDTIKLIVEAPSFSAIPRRTINIDDTVQFRLAPGEIGVVGYAGPQSPPPPLPKPPPTKDDTERLWLGGVEADVNGELRSAVPLPRPIPYPPNPNPQPKPKLRRSVPYVMPDDRAPWSAPRHAAPAPLWTRLAIAAGLALLLSSALALIVLAVMW